MSFSWDVLKVAKTNDDLISFSVAWKSGVVEGECNKLDLHISTLAG